MDKNIRILLVDDEESFSKNMSKQLVLAGFEVDVATSGKEVLKLARGCNGNYQVAVIDQVMGPPNGIDIMLALRQVYPGIEVILLTGWGDMEPGEKAMELGAFRYLPKPVTPKGLSLDIRCAARFGKERRKSLSLERLVSAGQRIGGVKSEEDLYHQIYKEVGELLPDLDGFLISQYDAVQDIVNFPFSYRGGEPFEIKPREHGNGITEFILKSQKPLLLSQGDEEFRKTNKIDSPDPGLGFITSEIAAPMFLDKQIIGTINALSFTENTQYTTEQLQIFQAFANQSALAIRNVREFVEATQLKDALSALTGKWEKKALLEAIVREAHKLIDCKFTGLILQDENKVLRKVRPVIPESYDKNFAEPRQQGGLTREVVESRKPIVIRDTFEDRRVKERVRKAGVHSMLILPLCYGDLVLGVIYGHRDSTNYFSDHDVELWTAFTTHAAAALYNAIEDERRKRDFDRLEEVTKSLKGTENLRTTMRDVATAAMNIFESDTCRLAFVEPATKQIVDWAWARNTPKKYRVEIPPRSDGFTNQVLRTMNPIFYSIKDLDGPPPIPELISMGLKYTLSMPLLIDGRVTGVLHCNYLDKREPDYGRLQNLVQAFCSRAAIVLHRARHDYLNAIWYELDQKIVSCNKVKELYREFVRHAHRASGAALTIFYPFDPTRSEDNYKTIRDDIIYEGRLEQPWEEPAGGQAGGVIEALKQSQDGLLIVNNLDNYKGMYTSQLSTREAVRAFVAVCLWVFLPGSKTKRLAGILFHDYRSPTAFEKADLTYLQSAGASVAQGILRLNLQSTLENALDERKKLLSAATDILHAFEREGREMDPKMIAMQVVDILGFDACTVMLYDHKGERFLLRGSAGVRYPNKHYTIPMDYKTRFMDAADYSVIADVQDDESFRSSNYIKREEIMSSIIFPLRVEGKALGLLFADNRHQEKIPQETIEALSLFADFAALVLHESQLNAELDATQKKLRQRFFLDWVSMIEATWRHSLVQRAATILNEAGSLKKLLERASSLPEAMKNVPSMIEIIDRQAHEIADAPPRVPQSWETEPEPLPLVPLLEEVSKREFRPPLPPLPGTTPLITPKFELEALGGIEVRGHRRWLIYALEALLQNARKAMPRGGTITIMGKRTANWVEVRIRDTGDGIPKEIRNKLFRELIPPKDDKKGMGIGSLLVATIIEMHDGEVSLEKPGPGDTTILIRLPYIRGQ